MKWMLFASVLIASTVCDDEFMQPTVFTVILVRNKAAILPHFFTFLDQLDYPRKRLSLWIRSDHCDDGSGQLLQLWMNSRSHLYHSVSFRHSAAPVNYPDELSQSDWSKERFRNLIRLKEEAFEEARKSWADFIWFLDVDVLLTNPLTLKNLVGLRKPIAAPLLKSFGKYSNFWGAMTPEYYYSRSDDYVDLLDRKKLGTFQVPLVHSCVLVDLRRKASQELSYDPTRVGGEEIPFDDIIALAVSANRSGCDMFVTNEEQYGVIPLVADVGRSAEDEADMLTYLKLMASELTHEPLRVSPIYGDMEERKTTAESLPGTAKTYLINLERRPERRRRMEYCFNELGIKAEWKKAVDGSTLTPEYLKENDIRPYAEFRDPHGLRPIKFGEIGCFMSHYHIWQDVVANGYEVAAVFEDDIHFELSFMARVRYALWEAEQVEPDWDLMYLGRKILRTNETWVPGARTLLYPDYTYWTLSYLITLEGAKKLLAADPLKTLLPVDEYLPIMFDKHPNKTLSSLFPLRTLKALAVSPMAVNPTHYTGQPGYVSDTESTPTAVEEANRGGEDVARETVGFSIPPELAANDTWTENVYSYSKPGLGANSFPSSYGKPMKMTNEL